MPAWNKFLISPHQKFGRLTTIRALRKRNDFRKVVWICKCSCGKQTEVISQGLRSGKTKSCGCLNEELKIGNTRSRKEPGQNGFTRIFCQYKRQAKVRGYEFLLSKEQFKKLTQQNCYYCGQKPSNKSVVRNRDYTKSGIKHTTYIYSGIDRKNNKIGYTKKNCVACCSVHNRMKMNLDELVFKREIKKLYNYIFERKTI